MLMFVYSNYKKNHIVTHKGVSGTLLLFRSVSILQGQHHGMYIYV